MARESAERTAEELASYEAWRAAHILEVWQRVGLFVALAALVWWPTDWWFFAAGSPERAGLAWMRTVLIPLNLAAVAVLPRWSVARARPLLCIVVLVHLELAIAGVAVGKMGETWVGFLYLAPLFTSLVPVSLRPRLVMAGSAWAAAWSGYALSAAAAGSERLLVSMGFSLFGVLLGVLIGHVAWSATESAHVAELRLRRLAASLQATVDAQTASLRRLLDQVDAAREEERTALAREIHDELGQELSALRITLAFGRQRPGGTLFDELDRLLDRTGRSVRRLLLNLRPRALDELGLVGGLRWLVEQAEGRGLVCSLDAPASLSLGARADQALFRCAQEALTNVARHAEARRVDVRLAAVGDRVRLEVVDDGRGLAEGADRRGFGMLGMAERARALGGAARWSSDGAGTRVEIDIPNPGTPA